jgi:hypothetical protein
MPIREETGTRRAYQMAKEPQPALCTLDIQPVDRVRSIVVRLEADVLLKCRSVSVRFPIVLDIRAINHSLW